MGTIKNYTDIEQSKKLSEFLQLENADMIWVLENPDLPMIKAIPYEDSDYNNKYLNIIPAWSLAALLGVIKEQGIMDLRFLQSTFDNRGNHLTNVWNLIFEDIGNVSFDIYANNPIDVCYEMILKLNKLNML